MHYFLVFYHPAGGAEREAVVQAGQAMMMLGGSAKFERKKESTMEEGGLLWRRDPDVSIHTNQSGDRNNTIGEVEIIQ